ncbi:MAG: winged helix-turn-helix domain-containing protein [Candidatus Kariarchaeaceae archaeon]
MDKIDKREKIYSTGVMAALNHPIRLTLYNLIQEGNQTSTGQEEGITTPEMAEILKENRFNLYHHLGILEKAGLIESFYEGNRMKKYRLGSKKNKINPKKFKIDKKKDLSPEVISKTQTMILTPSIKEKNKFKDKVKELIKLTNNSWDEKMDIQQIHIHWQWSDIVEYKQEQMKEIQKKHKQRK